MIKILPAITPAHFQEIETLANTIWREHYIPIIGKAQVDYMLDKFQSAKTIAEQVQNGFDYFLITFEDTPACYIAIKTEEEALFLSKIYVLSTYRGKKIAKAGLLFIEEKAKKQGLKAIRLTVNINNTNAIKAYEKIGFVNVGSLVADIGNGFVMDDFEMVKAI
ncbi:GNAT family N-acetyltransferase [Mariniflexile sp. AS56]|uniref:GNAT family N-acetyltransferase n=1 Tax=Mariniflexile sp. AS56 TaxID=3063957 RepID=UPI0026F070FA|nr:GNAT family N-acetyltransferase [Mariniflexile sp. AS56]MDO7172755.1 GNAT family N-acetyltransferase [Mariniflexile sp. AS56]